MVVLRNIGRIPQKKMRNLASITQDHFQKRQVKTPEYFINAIRGLDSRMFKH